MATLSRDRGPHGPAARMLFGGLCLALAVAAGCNTPPPRAPEAPKVTVEHPVARELIDYAQFNGRMEASQTVEVRSRVRGHITPEEARRIARKLEFHYTPKHGSWLNMAEMEFSVLSRQCLDRRIATAPELAEAIAAWERERNEARTKIEWTSRVADARRKLHGIYPS